MQNSQSWQELPEKFKFALQNPALIERELATRHLVHFIKQAWHIVEPGQPYVHGWHIDAMAEHLEAVTSGQINRLLINIPPGTMKSLTTSVFWPAWEWCRSPHYRYVMVSHKESLAVRDNVRMRRLISSDWYQQRWPLQLMADQNAKMKFENDKHGSREACAAGGITGSRGDRVGIDDPHSVESAAYDNQRKATLEWFSESVPTRMNNPATSAIIVTMQRLHEEDVSGLILERELGYDHLCLPMEYEPGRKFFSSIGFTDPRQVEGELLFPERFSREVVERDKRVMGSQAVAGQFQQRPAPAGGGMFKTEGFKVVQAMPGDIAQTVRYWDKAGTEGGGAYTAGVKMSRLKNGQFVIWDVQRGQWSALAREKIIRQTAELDGVGCDVWIEQEPGSGGKESAESTVRNLSGFVARAERVTGAKEVRAQPYAAQVEAGNIMLLVAGWNRDFIDEHGIFPSGKYKDQVDAGSGAFNKLTGGNKEAGVW